MSDTIEVFISYSKQDKALRDGLLSHLRPLEGAGIITWHDRQILPGTQWDAEIKARLNAADIILLLISADFLDTDYCTQVEIPAALRRHKAGEAIVMPVILRSCAWRFTPLAPIQAYPEKAKPIVSWDHIDEAYTNVVDSVDLAATKIKERRSQQRAEQERIQRERQRQAEEQERLRQAEQLRQQQAAEEARLKQRELEQQQQEQLKQAAARSKQLATQQNQSSEATKGDYAQLEALLKAGKWKEADRETAQQMYQVMGRQSQGWLRVEDVHLFSCADLRAIDQLWVTHSKGKFGFSVQKKIWEQCGSPTEDNRQWEKFGEAVGWRSRGLLGIGARWGIYSLDDSSAAPRGYFPAWCGGGPFEVFVDYSSRGFGQGAVGSVKVWQLAGLLFSRTKMCKL
ncbi:GUN4 domain-containing protein [Leptolyngbya sp. CCY15150]|uniref:GUN4 domain-containing protein n=1 Tax=Leptolyngbya sp. CCY15150 TaxID=2767772 RepID=UPI00194DC99C|nr:GUN4 domain-containing protein [Leptolyngbya sp. CCY15150]